MIHMLQCLCGPARHCIMAMVYDDKNITPDDVMDGLKALIEMQVDHKMINRRCEICDKGIVEFWYEDHITKEQDWDKVKLESERLEVEQILTQAAVKAARKGSKN